MSTGRVFSRDCGKFRTGAPIRGVAMATFSLTPTGWSDNESVWGRIWRGEIGFDFDDGQFLLEVQPDDGCESRVLLSRNRRIIKEPVMAPRKNIRRQNESSTATLTPPPVTPAATATSKFIEARPGQGLASPVPTKQQIRERAYQIYLARNGRPGDPTTDWLQAERELTSESLSARESRA